MKWIVTLLLLAAFAAHAQLYVSQNVYLGEQLPPSSSGTSLWSGWATNGVVEYWPMNENSAGFLSSNNATCVGLPLDMPTPMWTNCVTYAAAVVTNYDAYIFNRPVNLQSNFTIIVSACDLPIGSAQQLIIDSVTYGGSFIGSGGLLLESGDFSSGYFFDEPWSGNPGYIGIINQPTGQVATAFAIVRNANNLTDYVCTNNSFTNPVENPFFFYSSYQGLVTIRGIGSRYTGQSNPGPGTTLAGISISSNALSIGAIQNIWSNSLLAANPNISSALNGNNLLCQSPMPCTNTCKLGIGYIHGAGETNGAPICESGVDYGRGGFFAVALTNGMYVYSSDLGGDGYLQTNTGWANTPCMDGVYDMLNYGETNGGVTKWLLVGCSMGGLAATVALANRSDVVAIYNLFPVESLWDMSTNTFDSDIYTNAISTCYPGATSYSSFTNISWGHDPMLLPVSDWSGKYAAFTFSFGDQTVDCYKNAMAMATNMQAGGAAYVETNFVTGDHAAAQNFTNTPDFLNFLQLVKAHYGL